MVWAWHDGRGDQFLTVADLTRILKLHQQTVWSLDLPWNSGLRSGILFELPGYLHRLRGSLAVGCGVLVRGRIIGALESM